jgi:NTP pyrophosphatase (non-canonical NTP hydrolase)
MNYAEYQPLALRTAARLGEHKDITHACLGIVTEVGELCDQIKRNLAYGAPLDEVNLVEECGDVTWYVALLCEVTNQPMRNYGCNGVLLCDPLYRIALDASFYAAAVATNTLFRAENGLYHTYDQDVFKLMQCLQKICEFCGYTISDALERNIAKLAKRYPEKFTERHALIRDLDLERAALLGGASSASKAA